MIIVCFDKCASTVNISNNIVLCREWNWNNYVCCKYFYFFTICHINVIKEYYNTAGFSRCDFLFFPQRSVLNYSRLFVNKNEESKFILPLWSRSEGTGLSSSSSLVIHLTCSWFPFSILETCSFSRNVVVKQPILPLFLHQHQKILFLKIQHVFPLILLQPRREAGHN